MSAAFETTVANLLKARFPVLYVPTWEEERVLSKLSQVAADATKIKTARKVLTWSSTTGLIGDGISRKDDTKSPLRVLEFAEQ